MRRSSTLAAITALGLTGFLIAPIAHAATSAPATFGSISGTVTYEGGTGPLPASGARVQAYDADGDFAATAITDEQGDYTLTYLAAGDYTVNFSRWQNNAPQWWPAAADQGSAQAVAVAGAKPTSDIDATLVTGAALTGSVSRADVPGQALPLTQIDLVTPAGTVVATALSEADGSYELTGLTPGAHTLHFTRAEPGLGYTDSYAGQWWDGATGLATATTFELTAGQTATGFDAALSPSTAISGRVLHDAGVGTGPVAGVGVEIFGADGTRGQSVTTDEDGAFAFPGLPAGDYTLFFFSPAGGPWAYEDQWLGGAADREDAEAIALTADADVTRDVTLAPRPSGQSPAAPGSQPAEEAPAVETAPATAALPVEVQPVTDASAPPAAPGQTGATASPARVALLAPAVADPDSSAPATEVLSPVTSTDAAPAAATTSPSPSALQALLARWELGLRALLGLR